jgi:sugar/nucleoside kinase (ribokinase family)
MQCVSYLGKLQISEEEVTFLTGGDDPYDDDDVMLKKFFRPNLKLLLVTEGAQGCRYYTKVSIQFFRLTMILRLYSISANKFIWAFSISQPCIEI